MAILSSAPRWSNLGKVSQYVDKVADLGKRNLLFRVNVKHIYSIWQLSQEEYKLGLLALNHFYNFGRQLGPEGVNKLFTFTMRCGEYQESIKLLEGTGDWLQKPPNMDLVYALISNLISQKDYASVKRVFKAVRSNWQLKLTDRIYTLCIESMLCMKENPLEEALMVYCDATIMDVSLPHAVHSLLLDSIQEQMLSDPENEEKYLCIIACMKQGVMQ